MNYDPESSRLLKLHKDVADGKVRFRAPLAGNKLEIKLRSQSEPSQKFTLTIAEGKRSSALTIEISVDRKTTLQTRNFSDPLLRVDIDSKAIHTNPDGEVIKGSHVHVPITGYGCSYAVPLDKQDIMKDLLELDNFPTVFEAFRECCCITGVLQIEWSLGV